MAVLSHIIAGAVPLGRGLAAAGGDAIRWAGRVGRTLRNRRSAAALASLDDRMLADIGLTRSDLRDAYAEPLWHDPTDVLAGRAEERRLNSRRSSFSEKDAAEPSWLHCESACR